MALISISTTTVEIDNMVDSDATIQTAIRAFGNITTIHGLSIIPISNTKSKLIAVWT